MPFTPDVRPGQVWADNDKRSSGRTIRIIAIEKGEMGNDDAALVETLTAARNVGRTGVRTRIALRRFRPNSTGYRLVTDVDPEVTA